MLEIEDDFQEGASANTGSVGNAPGEPGGVRRPLPGTVLQQVRSNAGEGGGCGVQRRVGQHCRWSLVRMRERPVRMYTNPINSSVCITLCLYQQLTSPSLSSVLPPAVLLNLCRSLAYQRRTLHDLPLGMQQAQAVQNAIDDVRDIVHVALGQ